MVNGKGSRVLQFFRKLLVKDVLPRWADCRVYPDNKSGYGKPLYQEGEFNKNDVVTLSFNEDNILQGSEDLQKQIMEAGRNPGLGIWELHDEGVTGKDVVIGIIDQNLASLDHPEFAGKVVEYYDTGCNKGIGSNIDCGSMHAPMVLSLLNGKTIGTAPDAKVYFAAAPGGRLADSKYYVAALNWMIEQNRTLSVGKKIRAVSISCGWQAGSDWDKAVRTAQREGILVLDCTSNPSTGIIAPAYFDPDDRNNLETCKPGFPDEDPCIGSRTKIHVPCAYRTVAEENPKGKFSYLYSGHGGLSRSIPYAAGVLAMGWQIRPDLNGEAMVKILYDTCYRDTNGVMFINPPAFIAEIKELLQ